MKDKYIDKYFENGNEVFIRIPYKQIEGYGIVTVDKEDFIKFKEDFLNYVQIDFLKENGIYKLRPIVRIIKNGQYEPPSMCYRILEIEKHGGATKTIYFINSNPLDLRKRNMIVLSQSDIQKMKNLAVGQTFNYLTQLDEKVELRHTKLTNYLSNNDNQIIQKINKLEEALWVIAKELGISIPI